MVCPATRPAKYVDLRVHSFGTILAILIPYKE